MTYTAPCIDYLHILKTIARLGSNVGQLCSHQYALPIESSVRFSMLNPNAIGFSDEIRMAQR